MGQKQSSADEINKEIEQMAQKMNKSVTDTKQALFDTILSLGPEGLKKAYPLLSPEQRELFKGALSEMKKATHMPEVTQDADVLSPVHTKTKNAKLKTESLSGSDDEDEKLMADKNKDIDHQGDHSPEGIESPVIKAQEPEKADCPDDMVIGHTMSGKHIYDEPEHEMHKDFSPEDHKDAQDLHMRIAAPIRSKMQGPIDKDDKRSPEEREKDHVKMYHQARMHEDSARKHSEEAARKEDAHMEKHYGSLMKDMGYTGGAGGYGLAMSMDKSFKEVEEHAREEGARDPKAVAAAVGFKKLGKEEMERRAQAGKEKAEKSYENFMTKAEKEKLAKKQGVPEGVDPEKQERCVRELKHKPGVDNPYAVCNASMTKGEDMDNKEECMDSEKEKLEKKKMRKAKRIAKALKKIVKFAKALGMSKDDVKKAIEDAGGDLQIVKSDMKSKINKEEDQVEIKTQDENEITDPKPDQSKGDLEIKAEASADEAEKKLPEAVSKSIQYNFKSSIAARSLGRNTHWDVDAFIEKSEQEKQEIIKKGGYFGEEKVEELKKSQDAKLDINDMLEKGYDKYSQEEINRIEGLKNHKPDAGAVRKSNYDLEIARSMGMTKEEYEKIFGSNE